MQNKNKRICFNIHKKNLARRYENIFSCSCGECRSMAAHAENFAASIKMKFLNGLYSTKKEVLKKNRKGNRKEIIAAILM